MVLPQGEEEAANHTLGLLAPCLPLPGKASLETAIRGCLEGSSTEPGSAVGADHRPLLASLPRVRGGLNFLSAAAPDVFLVPLLSL